jgi:hypothetical protein
MPRVGTDGGVEASFAAMVVHATRD